METKPKVKAMGGHRRLHGAKEATDIRDVINTIPLAVSGGP